MHFLPEYLNFDCGVVYEGNLKITININQHAVKIFLQTNFQTLFRVSFILAIDKFTLAARLICATLHLCTANMKKP